MRRILVASTCCVLGSAGVTRAQCPNGTPRPCDPPRRSASARPTPPPENVRARQMMFLPFRNITRAPANDWLITGAPLMLGEALGWFSDLSVVPEQRLTAAMRRFSLAADVPPDAAQLRQLAEETGGWTAISGNVIASGNTLRISAQALDVATSRVIASGQTEIATNADIREAFDRLTVQLLQAVGVRGARSDLVALTTKSVDAYRAYVEGVALNQRGAYRQAKTLLTEAVRRDSTFALAWAELAISSMSSGGWAELMNPIGGASQAIEQAVRNSSRLGSRQVALLHVVRNVLHGDFARSHYLADSLVASDPDDPDARQWLAMVEMFDSRLDTTVTPVSRKGSFNRGIEMARAVLEMDPGRHEVFLLPATFYAFSAGFMGPIIGGRRKPVGSLAAEFLVPADVLFTPVLRDSIEFVLDTVFARIPAAEQRRLRLGAVDAGLDWVNRWLSSGPADPEAHIWASRFHELREDYQRAYQEQQKADSIGIESNVENLRARRLMLLELTGRYPAAEALADSIFKSGGVALRPLFSHWIDRSRTFVTAVFLRSKQWEKAVAVAKVIGAPRPGRPVCESLMMELKGYSPPAPPSELRAIADTVAAHLNEVLRIPELAPCANDLAKPPG